MKDTKQTFTPRISIAVRAWNEDAAIVFNRADTLANMYAALLNNPRACSASDCQNKDIGFKNKKTLRDRISLATSGMTHTIEGQITGQA